MSNSLFYFTGTGNSLKIAKDIVVYTKISDFNVMSIAKNISEVETLKPGGIVGFIFPVFYCGIPQIVRNFMEKINLSNVSYVFVIATYGATGGNGGCLHQARNILSQKNIKLNAGFYIKTVDNFILWAWDAPSIKKQEKLHILAENKIKNISDKICKKVKHFDKSFVEYTGPIIFGYKRFIANVNKTDKLFSTGLQCNSCGICSKVCPTYNITTNNGRPEWKSEYCQRCLACLHLCPKKTIEYGKNTKNKQRYKNPFIKLEELYNIK